MKQVFYILIGILVFRGTAAFYVDYISRNDKIHHVFPLPEYYREMTGYDSVQILDPWECREVNLCWPNGIRNGFDKNQTRLILGAHVHFDENGSCLYDSMGRLIRTESGRCDSIEKVYDHGKWVPWSECSYCNTKKEDSL